MTSVKQETTKTIYVDIDETVCSYEDPQTLEERDYEKGSPIKENIDRINKLYDEGHTIVYWTARGAVTNKDWKSLTYAQLICWGAKFHELKMGKPFYDLLIDDRTFNPEDWENGKTHKFE